MDDPEIVRLYHLFDVKYRLGELRGASAGGATLLRRTESPLLLTAPHSVTQIRREREKPAEFWTGALAETVAELTGANVLTALSPRNETHDAASEDHYLSVLRLLLSGDGITTVVDIHGLKGGHGIDINIGTAGLPERSSVIAFADELSSRFAVTVDQPFNGGRGATGMINGNSSIGSSAIQLELGPRLRRDTVDGDEVRTVAAAVLRFSESMSREQ